MRKMSTAVMAASLLFVSLGAPGASAADEPQSKRPATSKKESATSGVVGGKKYGPKDGYEVTTESHPVVPGQDPLEVSWGGTPAPPSGEISPMAYWGSSYATSTETAYVFYTGRAKAAGNVYNNQRIVKVCISYSHTLRSSPTVCSSATSTGSSWYAGAEASVGFTDNLSDNWPQTSFNISTTRINPNVY